jgi:hypothetical protein
LVLLRPQMGGLAGSGLGRPIFKMCLATMGMVMVLVGLMPVLSTDNKWLGGIGGIVVGGLVYAGLAYLVRLDEIEIVRRKVMARLEKPSLRPKNKRDDLTL